MTTTTTQNPDLAQAIAALTRESLAEGRAVATLVNFGLGLDQALITDGVLRSREDTCLVLPDGGVEVIHVREVRSGYTMLQTVGVVFTWLLNLDTNDSPGMVISREIFDPSGAFFHGQGLPGQNLNVNVVEPT